MVSSVNTLKEAYEYFEQLSVPDKWQVMYILFQHRNNLVVSNRTKNFI